MKWKQSMKKLLRDKGYYLTFALCLAAVAVSGWLYVRSLDSTDEELSVPEAVQAAVLPTLPEGGERAAADKPGQIRPIHPVGPTAPATEAPSQSATEPPVKTAATRLRPLEGEVSQGYSMDKLAYNATTRDWRTHPGLDIAAPEGSEVRAAAEGRVLAVRSDDLLGRIVTVEHEGGWVTHYANLAEETAVTAGEQVAAGQKLGTVGKTALAEIGSEPHLHFAVYKNNVPQDPEAFLAG